MAEQKAHVEPSWVWIPDEGAYGWHDGTKIGLLRARWTGNAWVYGVATPGKAPPRIRRLMMLLTALSIATVLWVVRSLVRSPAWDGNGLPLRTVCCEMSNSEALGVTWTPFLILAVLAAAGVVTWWKGGRRDSWVAAQMSLGLVAALMTPFALMTLFALGCIDTLC